MKKFCLSLAFASSALFSIDYSLGSDYCFVDGSTRGAADGSFVQVAKQNFKEPGFESTHLLYSEAAAAAFINAYLSEKNAFSFELGYSNMDLNWNGNPSFTQKHFNDVVATVAFVSTALEKWRWVINAGAHLNVDHFSFSNNTFYTGMLWGRYQYMENIGVSIGVIGQSGNHSTYILPIIGIDWGFWTIFRLHGIFPLDLSFRMYFMRELYFAVTYRGFGGWYKSFHGVGSDEPLPNAQFSTYASGVDGGIYYDKGGYYAILYGGYNFGGWVLIRDKFGNNPNYYHFNGGPYAGIKAGIKF